MHKSDLPDSYEIRVLLTIKNGVVTERRVKPAEMVATPEEFVMVLRQAGEYHGFSGRLLLNIENGEPKKQTDIPRDYIFGSFDSLVELMRDAGYCVNPPAEMPDNKG
jgi:hypothetical protein